MFLLCVSGTKSHKLKLKTKYAIKKKIKEHNRKLKRDLRKHPEKRRKPRSDKGIPNSCPFKEDILIDMENQRKLKEQEHEAKRAELRERRKLLREAKMNGGRPLGNLENFADTAAKKDQAFENKSMSEVVNAEGERDLLHDTSAKAYIKEFRKVIEAADVILEVLDARDPIGTRCQTVEQAVMDAGANKRLVLLLNKAGNIVQCIK